MIKINVILNNNFWRKYIKDPQKFIDKKIKIINKKNQMFRKNILTTTLLLTGPKEIQKLNKKFRKKNKSTDVLSFPFQEKKFLLNQIKNQKEVYLGDIVINLNKIKFVNDTNDFENEFNKLWIHGLIHLFGHKHKKDKDFKIMSSIEKKYLNFLN